MDTPKMIEPLNKYCHATIGKVFSTEFVLDAKVENSTFWNISNSGLCCNSVALNKYQF